jgi:L,D-transpeptidase ErfK/SrfK
VLAQDAGTGLLTGEVISHAVARGESLASLSARFGIDTRTLAADNGIRADDILPIGRVLRIDNRHIVPSGRDAATLVINLPQRMLFFRGETVTGLPVAVGRPDWPTPTGDFTVATREENPTWDVPVSILAEARRAGRAQPARVPPGPTNPLGAFWLGLSAGGIGVHGTIVPASIYRFASHGCIRLHPDDVAWLFPRVNVGAIVAVVYEPVLLTRVGDRVFVEIHGDRYARQAPTLARVRELAVGHGVTDLVDWKAAARAVQARHGVARDITRAAGFED